MKIPSPLPEAGFAVPLRAAFQVLRRWPLMGVASNNLNPSLTLHSDTIEYKVLKSKRRSYADIATIDARQWIGGHDIIFHWRDAFFATRMNLARPELLVELLSFFSNRGCKLSARGWQLIAGAASEPSIEKSDEAKELSNG